MTFFVFIYLTRNYVHKLEWVRAMWKPVVSTAAMVGVTVLLAPLGLIIQLLGAAFVFAPLFLLLRPFDAEEVRMFRKALGLKHPTPTEEAPGQDML